MNRNTWLPKLNNYKLFPHDSLNISLISQPTLQPLAVELFPVSFQQPFYDEEKEKFNSSLLFSNMKYKPEEKLIWLPKRNFLREAFDCVLSCNFHNRASQIALVVIQSLSSEGMRYTGVSLMFFPSCFPAIFAERKWKMKHVKHVGVKFQFTYNFQRITVRDKDSIKLDKITYFNVVVNSRKKSRIFSYSFQTSEICRQM